MLSGIFADIVVFVHFLWILFLIAGAYWGRKYRPVMLIHGAGLAFAMISQLIGWYCPLTYLEAWLRARQGSAQPYPGSFIALYAEKLIYIDLSSTVIFLLTLALILVQAWFYRGMFLRNKQ
ncbi:MAG: DUF2784 domain-containing protein [Nitrospirae bacterium]|nr:DUF2784 domain-containing protein [Nitrospirota bacterium]NTW65683.1 DUF2784 domain-containing protein [Nitrospirota bacterium]